MSGAAFAVLVRRHIRAPVERVFAAWTEPEQLRAWWGPDSVSCPEASVDLRVGGTYRIANRMPDGAIAWIRGVFEAVEPPHRLVYSWTLDPNALPTERVTVRFEAGPDGTEVIVCHEQIPTEAARDGHEAGWAGCLQGLVRHLDVSGTDTP